MHAPKPSSRSGATSASSHHATLLGVTSLLTLQLAHALGGRMDEVASLVACARRMPAAGAMAMARRASANGGSGNAAGAQAGAAVELALPLRRPSPAPGVRLAGEGVAAPGMVLAGEGVAAPGMVLAGEGVAVPGMVLAGKGVPAPGMVLAGEDIAESDTTLPLGVTGGVPVVERRTCTNSMVKVGRHPRLRPRALHSRRAERPGAAADAGQAPCPRHRRATRQQHTPRARGAPAAPKRASPTRFCTARWCACAAAARCCPTCQT